MRCASNQDASGGAGLQGSPELKRSLNTAALVVTLVRKHCTQLDVTAAEEECFDALYSEPQLTPQPSVPVGYSEPEPTPQPSPQPSVATSGDFSVPVDTGDISQQTSLQQQRLSEPGMAANQLSLLNGHLRGSVTHMRVLVAICVLGGGWARAAQKLEIVNFLRYASVTPAHMQDTSFRFAEWLQPVIKCGSSILTSPS